MKNGANYNQLIILQLGEDLAKLKSGKSVIEPLKNIEISPAKFLLFETPFGREHFDSGQHINMLFWIDVPFDIALARNIKEFTSIFIKENNMNANRKNLIWLNNYLEYYVNNVREMLELQRK